MPVTTSNKCYLSKTISKEWINWVHFYFFKCSKLKCRTGFVVFSLWFSGCFLVVVSSLKLHEPELFILNLFHLLLKHCVFDQVFHVTNNIQKDYLEAIYNYLDSNVYSLICNSYSYISDYYKIDKVRRRKFNYMHRWSGFQILAFLPWSELVGVRKGISPPRTRSTTIPMVDNWQMVIFLLVVELNLVASA